jgi:hypothetical protein
MTSECSLKTEIKAQTLKLRFHKLEAVILKEVKIACAFFALITKNTKSKEKQKL